MRVGGVLAALAVGLVVAACAAGGAGGAGGASDRSSASVSAPTSADLDGSAFESTRVQGHDLVAGSTVRLTFESESLSAHAGCNTMSSAYGITSGRLAWTGHPMTTMIGCPDELMAQDAWLGDLLQQGADAKLHGDELTLVRGDVTLVLTRERTAGAAALLGRKWTVDGVLTESTASSIPSGVQPPTLDIATDGTVQLFTGCNRGRTTVTADGDTATFAPAAVTRMACASPADSIEQAVLAVVDGAVVVTVTGSSATLTKAAHGLVMKAS